MYIISLCTDVDETLSTMVWHGMVWYGTSGTTPQFSDTQLYGTVWYGRTWKVWYGTIPPYLDWNNIFLFNMDGA